MNNKQLSRIPSEGRLGGVAAGLADYFGIEKIVMRLILVVLFFASVGFPIFTIYVILWAVLPKSDASIGFAANSSEPSLLPVKATNTKSTEIAGFILLGIGSLILIDKLFYWIDFEKFIPAVILIGLGLFFILRDTKTTTKTTENAPFDNTNF
jgi:phage shock protein PspC (stress-responsive transcriptional regulator)